MLDVDECFPGSIRKYREGLNLLSQIVRMRINRQQIDVDRKREIVRDQKIFCACRNIEARIVFDLQKHWTHSCRFVCEVQSDAGLNHLRFSRGL